MSGQSSESWGLHQLEIVADAKVFIEKNFDQHITVKEVASSVYMSVFHFSRLFRKISGITVYQYIIQIRIKHAKRLLSENKSVTEAAKLSGFHSLEHFSHAFHRYEQLGPSHWKKRAND